MTDPTLAHPGAQMTGEPDGGNGYRPRFVVDAVLHAYNFNRENTLTPLAEDMLAMSYGLLGLTGDDALVTQEEYLKDWTIEEVAEVAFAESDVDVGVYHGVPWFDYFVDGFVSNDKGIEMRRRWPDRVLFYATLDPLAPDAVEQVEHLVKEGGANGIKLYPENWHHREKRVDPVLLDSPDIAPVMEKALELGVPLAIHKAIPAGQGIAEYYRLGDVEQAALRYPELQIEVVHSGAAFIEDTAYMLARYPNVWANLEVTSVYAVRTKRRFAEALGALLASGAGDRIIFATGCVLVHPQTILEALYDLTMPDDLVAGYGYPPVTPEILDGILGLNFARLHKLDHEGIRATIADDEFGRRKADGLRPKWSSAKEG